MTKTKAATSGRRPVGKLANKAKVKSVKNSKHEFDQGYEAGWKAGLVKGYHEGFDSIYASEN